MKNKKIAWQEQLSTVITDPKELLSRLALDETLLPAAEAAARLFPLKVPLAYLARIEKSNPLDPLLLQVLPLSAELTVVPGYDANPLKEDRVNPVPGLLHKYFGRVLITLTSACAIHCRYCFRRSFPYALNNPGKKGWEAIYDYIRKDVTISEVILSGGDPLSVSDAHLAEFIAGLSMIPHVKRLRFHTRLPIMIPDRVTDALLASLDIFPHQVVMVFHINHPNEMNEAVREAINKMTSRAQLLNQTVLLKNINNNVTTLTTLSETLFEANVLPYYLHALDKVNGAHHFDLEEAEAVRLHKAMQMKLPGYLVPKLVKEIPGQPFKTLIY